MSSSRSPTSRLTPPPSAASLHSSPSARGGARSPADGERPESSADETTPIIGRRNDPSSRNSTHGSISAAATDGPRPASSSSSVKRRGGGILTSHRGVASRSTRHVHASGSRQDDMDDDEHNPEDDHHGQRESKDAGVSAWWRAVVDKYGAVELDNKGSVARDHLALERTFLAWLRTSLAFASIGIAITQLFRLNTALTDREGLQPPPEDNGALRLRQMGKPLGATFLAIAIIVLFIGGRRYFESQYWIIRGKFPASRGSIFLITFVAAALIVTSLVVVLSVKPTTFSGS